MPCGLKMPTNRCGRAAAVDDCAVPAGIIDSRKGNASAAPAPFSTVLLDMCFLVINILPLLASRSTSGLHGTRCRRFRIHLEGLAFDNTHDQCRESVVLRF